MSAARNPGILGNGCFVEITAATQQDISADVLSPLVKPDHYQIQPPLFHHLPSKAGQHTIKSLATSAWRQTANASAAVRVTPQRARPVSQHEQMSLSLVSEERELIPDKGDTSRLTREKSLSGKAAEELCNQGPLFDKAPQPSTSENCGAAGQDAEPTDQHFPRKKHLKSGSNAHSSS